MNKKNENQTQTQEQPKLSQADIQKLLMQQLMQQKGAAGAAGGALAPQKPQGNVLVRGATWALKNAEKTVYYIDRFINFVVKDKDPDRNDVMQTARYPILFGTWVTLICVVFGGIWSATAPLDSAATALGTVMMSSHKQVIIHPTGGIVKRIFVKQGDYVTENQPLIEFDETQLNTNYQAILGHYRSTLAQEARLIAERDNATTIQFDEFLLKESHKPEVAKILQTQMDLFKSNQETFNGMVEVSLKRIEQTKHQIDALKSKKIAADRSSEIAQERFKSLKELSRQGFAQKAQMLEAERQAVAAQSEAANTDIEIARTEQEVSRLEVELYARKNENLAKIMSQLKDTQTQLSEIREKYIQAKDSLNRVVIKSPVEGVVNDLPHHTVGSFISPGHPVAEITPYKGNLIIEAKIPQKEIESLRVGLKAKVRFSAFKSRTTPVFSGTVVSLSPDTVQDRQTQAAMQNPMGDDSFYVARIEIDMDEFNKIAKQKDLKLLPGMKAEIQIVRGTRTLLQYLIDPITDQMFKAFKEK